MFKNFVTAAIILATLFLAGCAGQSYYLAAQDPRNPYSFIQITGKVPTPTTLCVEEEGDIFKMSCEFGQLNMRKVGKDRQYSCVQQNGSTVTPSKVWVPYVTLAVCPMGVVDQPNQNQKQAGGNQFGNGNGGNGGPVLDSLSQFCQPNGCGKDQYGNWVRN